MSMMCPPHRVKMASIPSALRARATRCPPLTVRAAVAGWRWTAVAMMVLQPLLLRQERRRHEPALYLPRRPLGQLPDDVDHLGHLEDGQAGAAVGLELLRVGLGP